jgi:general secretion pathway protein D
MTPRSATTLALALALQLAVAAGGLVAAPVRAQDEPPNAAGAAPATVPQEAPRPLRPDDLVTMDFQDVEIATLVKFVSEITGRNFLVDDKVKGKVSIISPSKITVDEAYRVFQSVLQVKGFSVVDTGPVVKIVPTKDIKGAGLPLGAGPGAPSEAFVTRLLPLKHLEAAQAAQVLQPLVSRDGLVTAYAPTNSLILIDSAVNVARLVELVSELDVPGQERTVEVIPLHHAFAGDLAGILREASEEGATRTRTGTMTTTTLPGVTGTTTTATARGGDASGGLRVVPDERSNAIIVIGSPFEIRQARELVRKLDVPLPKGSGRVQVYPLRYGDATEMVQVLAELVGTSTNVQRREVLPGRAVTEGGGRFGRSGYGAAGSGGGAFGRSVISNSQAGSLGQGMGSLRGRGGFGGAAGGAAGGGIASAGSGAPAIEFESGVRITADPATNSLVISAAPQDYAILEEVIQKLDIARRQVLVEAIIFEISLTRAKQLGIELQGAVEAGNAVGFARTSFRNLNTVTNAATGDISGLGSLSGLLAALISKQSIELADGTKIPASAAILSALQSTVGVNVLSAPTILTTDNEEAEIVVGQNVPFVTSRSTNETNLQNTFSQIDRRDVGITLRLTPQISEGDSVRLLIFQEVSALVQTPPEQVLQLGPTTTVRSATTNVVVEDAETVAIGGLISDTLTNTDSGVPYLTDIPVVGQLFRFQDRRKEKVNLIILLTPHIIRDENAMASVTAGEKARFREAMVGKGRFAGTHGSLAPERARAGVPTGGGVLLPAEGAGPSDGELLEAAP